eukprot:441113-Prorocentrum_minimum.AAC.2
MGGPRSHLVPRRDWLTRHRDFRIRVYICTQRIVNYTSASDLLLRLYRSRVAQVTERALPHLRLRGCDRMCRSAPSDAGM